MDNQRTKDFLNISIKFVVLCGIIVFIAIVGWKLAISDIFFDFTNFTPNDIILILLLVFFLSAFWLFLTKFISLIEKRSVPLSTSDELINKLIQLITEHFNKSHQVEHSTIKPNEFREFEQSLSEISYKLTEIIELIKNISIQNTESPKSNGFNLGKIQNNITTEPINQLLKKIITDNFELSTLKMLPVEILEFRVKKILNNLDQNIINDLKQYEIVDDKKHLTEKGKTKFIELINSL